MKIHVTYGDLYQGSPSDYDRGPVAFAFHRAYRAEDSRDIFPLPITVGLTHANIDGNIVYFSKEIIDYAEKFSRNEPCMPTAFEVNIEEVDEPAPMFEDKKTFENKDRMKAALFAIQHVLSWDDTKEGFEYWGNVCDALKKYTEALERELRDVSRRPSGV